MHEAVCDSCGYLRVLSVGMLWAIARLMARQKARTPFRPNAELFKGAIGYGLRFFIPLVDSAARPIISFLFTLPSRT